MASPFAFGLWCPRDAVTGPQMIKRFQWVVLCLAFVAACTVAQIPGPVDAKLHGGKATSGGTGNTAFTIYNTSGSTITNVPVTFEQPFQTGDVTTSQKIQILDSDGSTVLTTQEDDCSQWVQDSSRKACALSFVASSISGASKTFYWRAASGSPNTTPNVTKANITGNTNFCLKTSDLKQASSTAETGTWDMVCLNTVLNSYNQYDGTTGYGSNPVGGWEYYATGPNRLGVHAFQYAIRESDGAIHKWLRTDMWIDFWGSGSTPCPCSVSTLVSEPNIFGPQASGTVGPARGSEPAYVFSATLSNGASTLWNFGGGSDTRNLTNLTSANFTTTGSKITLSAGTGYDATIGVYPVTFSSTGSLPSGLTAGTIYWIAPDALFTNNIWIIYSNQCDYGGNGTGCTNTPTTITTTGSGTITMTPYTSTTAFGGWMGMDTKGQRIWTNSSGTLASAPATLTGHDFSYLTQKSKAVPPYIVSLLNGGSAISGTGLIRYYPNSYYLPYTMDITGDGEGDNRIGYVDSYGVFTLFNPGDANAQQRSSVLAASFALGNMYNIDETVGLPVVLNNGHAKNGVTYATLGTVQPGTRTYPYAPSDSGGTWMTISSAHVDNAPFTWTYGAWFDPSHLPAPMQAPLLKTGQPEWVHLLVNETNATLGSAQYTSQDPGNGTTYYRAPALTDSNFGPSNQERGVGWATRVAGQANYFTPTTSPVSLYLRDLVQDAGGFPSAQLAFLPSQALPLGYWAGTLWSGLGTSGYQPWQSDFVFLTMGMEAWRGEYSSFGNFLTTHFYKNVVGRADPSSAGVGCLWAGPARIVQNYNGTPVNGVYTNLATAWQDVWSQSTAAQGTAGGWPASWTNCAAQTTGLITDGPIGGSQGSFANAPVGVFQNETAALGMASVLGISNASSIYSTIRTMEYSGTQTVPPGCEPCRTSPLVFTPYYEWAIGPLGATN